MRAEPPLANKEGSALSQARLARRFAAACFGKPVHFSFLLAEKRFDFLLPDLSHTAFLEGVRGNHSLASKEWFPRIITPLFFKNLAGEL